MSSDGKLRLANQWHTRSTRAVALDVRHERDRQSRYSVVRQRIVALALPPTSTLAGAVKPLSNKSSGTHVLIGRFDHAAFHCEWRRCAGLIREAEFLGAGGG